MPEIGNTFYFNSLSAEDRSHWELHLNVALWDTPSHKKEVDVFLKGGELPKLNHPSYIHDWLKHPERRVEIEAYNG